MKKELRLKHLSYTNKKNNTYDFELTRKSTQSLCASNLSKPENGFLAHFSPKLSGKCHMHHRYNPS